VQGTKIRERSKTFADHYTQAALFYNSVTLIEQEHIAQALIFELGKVSDVKIQKLMLDHVAKVDDVLAGKVALKLGMEAPKGQSASRAGKTKGLSQSEGPKDSIKGRKIAILAADGVSAGETKQLEAALKKEGASAEVVAPHLGELKGGLKVDKSLATSDSVMYDAVYIPGGKESVTMLLGDYEARHFVRDAYDHGKAIATSAEGNELLQSLGIKDGPGVVTDKSGGGLSKSFVDSITQHRHWNRAKPKM
jgi:catalase